jgi:uncharacterized protein (DUF433 family)
VKGIGVPVQAVLDNVMAGCTAEQIAREIFDLNLDQVRRILSYVG